MLIIPSLDFHLQTKFRCPCRKATCFAPLDRGPTRGIVDGFLVWVPLNKTIHGRLNKCQIGLSVTIRLIDRSQ